MEQRTNVGSDGLSDQDRDAMDSDLAAWIDANAPKLWATTGSEVHSEDGLLHFAHAADEPTAARIVQCVNAHDDLVAALREMVKQFGYEVVHPVGMVHDEHEAIRRAMAALAKAGEQQ